MRNILPFLLLTAMTLPCAAQAGQYKAGLWEIKIVKQVIDGRNTQGQLAAAQAQMQKAMANMPAAQRKQMEAMMKQHGAGMEQPGAIRVCISPAMAARDEPLVDADGHCKPAKVSRSGNSTRYQVDCTRDGRRMIGSGDTVFAGNSMQSRMDMTVTDAQGRHQIQTESRMSWLGADCGTVKPVDQIVSEMQQHLPKR